MATGSKVFVGVFDVVVLSVIVCLVVGVKDLFVIAQFRLVYHVDGWDPIVNMTRLLGGYIIIP
jgi:high-affinity nickel permease